MKISGALSGYYFMVLILAGIFIIICIFLIRHMVLDFRRKRRGLHQFFTCHGKERWGPQIKVKEWQRTAIRHLIAQRDTLDNDTWQMKNRRNNLAEMEQVESKKLSALETSRPNSKVDADIQKSMFNDFEITRSRAKLEDLRNRIQQKDTLIRSMEQARQRVNKCLKAYSKGENPRLPVLNYIRGLFFDLH